MYYKYKLFKLIYSNFAISFKYKAFQGIFFEKSVRHDGLFFRAERTLFSNFLEPKRTVFFKKRDQNLTKKKKMKKVSNIKQTKNYERFL